MTFLLKILFIFFATLWAQEPSSGFLDGVNAYKNKNFQKAQEIFTPLVQENPENPALLYNLGLAEYQLGRFGMALGLWRKARNLDSSFTPVEEAIAFTEEKLFPDKGHETFIVSIYKALTTLPLWMWCSLSLLTFFLASYFSLEYGVKKRLSINLWPTWVFTIFPIFLFSTFFAFNLFTSSRQMMGTVIERNLLTHANPTESSPTLSELEEGQVVSVEKVHQNWLQIRSQRGAPGWVPQSSVIIFKGR